MTEQKLKELEELCEKATPLGPECPEKLYLFAEDGDLVATMRDVHGADANSDADYEFYRAARTALPELIDEINRLKIINEDIDSETVSLRAEVKRLRESKIKCGSVELPEDIFNPENAMVSLSLYDSLQSKLATAVECLEWYAALPSRDAAQKALKQIKENK